MEGYDRTTYGERFADVYDAWYGELTDAPATVDALAAIAGPAGRVLELGVGTGRLAIPLAERVAEVVGVDTSPAMLERLTAKAAAGVPVRAVLADMAAPGSLDELGGSRFDLVFVAYNSLFNLVGDGEQARCFASVADVLAPEGRFVVEAFVPATGGHDGAAPAGPTSTVEPRAITADHVVLSVSRADPQRQEALGQYVDITADGIRLRPWHIRWSTPEQLDAMAAAAGLVLDSRSAGWDGAAFDDTATTHVSRYRFRG